MLNTYHYSVVFTSILIVFWSPKTVSFNLLPKLYFRPLCNVFIFCWPCISIHLFDDIQLDAPFILSLFRPTASTYFGHIQYIHSIPPDDGLKICPKHVEVDWRNKLRINYASSWFSLCNSRNFNASFARNTYVHP
jgi:hypothetical protein